MITISDTAGEDFSSMRPLSYPNADAFIFCYSIDQPDSLKHLRDKWMHEIRHFCPATPVLVVGNKKDLRCSSENTIPTKEAAEIAKQITNLPLIECSAKTREVTGEFHYFMSSVILERTSCIRLGFGGRQRIPESTQEQGDPVYYEIAPGLLNGHRCAKKSLFFVAGIKIAC